MSIILDALKKAEKDRSTPDEEGQLSSTATIIEDSKKGSSQMTVRPALLVVFLLFSVLIFAGVSNGSSFSSPVRQVELCRCLYRKSRIWSRRGVTDIDGQSHDCRRSSFGTIFA